MGFSIRDWFVNLGITNLLLLLQYCLLPNVSVICVKAVGQAESTFWVLNELSQRNRSLGF